MLLVIKKIIMCNSHGCYMAVTYSPVNIVLCSLKSKVLKHFSVWIDRVKVFWLDVSDRAEWWEQCVGVIELLL